MEWASEDMPHRFTVEGDEVVVGLIARRAANCKVTNMDLGINGKIALVTASSAGMGRNIAHALAAEGVNVVLFARSAEKLAGGRRRDRAEAWREGARRRRETCSCGRDVERLASALQTRIRRPRHPRAQYRPRAESAARHAGRIGRGAAGTRPTRTSCGAPSRSPTTSCPLMLERGWGRIIAITSASVKEPMPHHSLSTVFRAGVTAYMKHLANEVGAQRHHGELRRAGADRHLAPHAAAPPTARRRPKRARSSRRWAGWARRRRSAGS